MSFYFNIHINITDYYIAFTNPSTAPSKYCIILLTGTPFIKKNIDSIKKLHESQCFYRGQLYYFSIY